MNLKTLCYRINSLCVFKNLLENTLLSTLTDLLSRLCLSSETASTDADVYSLYSRFVYEVLASEYDSLAENIQCLVNNDENPYIRAVCIGKAVSPSMRSALESDLETMQAVADLTPDVLKAAIKSEFPLPNFEVKKVNIIGEYHKRCNNIGIYGYGIYAQYRMYTLAENAHIIPVKSPDTVSLDTLVDYEREKQIIIDNTERLLAGKPAANILLTGDAGTGKSSTIKAVVNKLYSKGLRILEVRKEQLCLLPTLLDELSVNPLKFIIFIDDLSFQNNDDNFNALKAVLEGSVNAKSGNVVIYATSNRRHLVKESFSSREGDDIHRNDSMQEILSLSARFGIHISFYKPDKQTYLHIVSHLAAKNGINLPTAELEVLAERFALEKGGRSARAATQFINSLIL